MHRDTESTHQVAGLQPTTQEVVGCNPLKSIFSSHTAFFSFSRLLFSGRPFRCHLYLLVTAFGRFIHFALRRRERSVFCPVYFDAQIATLFPGKIRTESRCLPPKRYLSFGWVLFESFGRVWPWKGSGHRGPWRFRSQLCLLQSVLVGPILV